MIKKIGAIAICCAAAVVLSGCSHITVLRTQELKEVQDRVDTLHSKLSVLQTKLLEEQIKLQEEQKTNSEMLRLMRADQQMRFNDIDRKVSAIENNIFESHSQLSTLKQTTTEVSRRLEQKLANDEEAAHIRKLQLEKLFEIAMGDFNAGRYDLAISGFRDLAAQFPESAEAPDAEYWIAESYYAKKDYESAEKAYFDFVKKYTDGPRYCVSLYKLGLAYGHQEKMKSRDMVWRNLLNRCADSPEAQAVKTQLKSEEQ
ncbi:MAG: outer membrane protein assembly factor BamD [Chitinispirillales bacterium]|jgi:tol-pal system protein YbgF|nr:outer membrane protein assembly factor BamD [Chitinispirillales bacterium]